MTEPMNENTQDTTVTDSKEERQLLLERAEALGLDFPKNITLPALRKLVSEKLEPKTAPANDKVDPNSRSAVRERATKLVRFKLVCQNPTRQQQPAITITVGNNLIGQVTRVLPLSPEAYAEGWHAEQCIVDALLAKRFHTYQRVKSKDGKSTTTKLVATPEFSIQILPPLTEEERKALAHRQAQSGSITGA